MTEYWLQKKTIGGWSHVIRYNDLEEANVNYKKHLKQGRGYSWRLVKVEVIQEDLLDEVVEIEAPNTVVEDKPVDKGGWGSYIPAIEDLLIGDKVNINLQSRTVVAVNSSKLHTLSGSVWLIHHGLKKKGRFPSSEVDAMIGQGYERGGPRTQFREG